MTDIAEARQALFSRFVTMWADRSIYTLQDENFTEPSPDTPWVRVSIRSVKNSQETLGPAGSRKFSRRGFFYVQIFQPLGSGSGASDTWIKALQASFEGVSISGTTIRCNDVDVDEGGRQDEWVMVVLRCDFEYDETK